MTAAAWALQQAVFAALAADTNLHAQIADRIFDSVPRGSVFPYVVLGEGSEILSPDNTSEHTLVLNVWSRSGGHQEVKRIAAALRDALGALPRSLSGHTLIDFRFATADYVRLSDGETYRAGLRFKALTEPQT